PSSARTSSGASATPRRSPSSSASSPPTTPRSSRARPTSSTAARSRGAGRSWTDLGPARLEALGERGERETRSEPPRGGLGDAPALVGGAPHREEVEAARPLLAEPAQVEVRRRHDPTAHSRAGGRGEFLARLGDVADARGERG